MAQGDLFGWAVIAIGDVNFDGIPEYGAVVGGAIVPGRIGVRTFDGATGASLHQVIIPTDSRSYGTDATGVGDWNQDGFPDYAVSDYLRAVNGMSSAGIVYCYSGLDGVLIDQLEGTAAGHNYGKGLLGGGDATRDGNLDLLIASEWGFGDSVDLIDGVTGTMVYRLSSLTGNGYFGSGLDYVPDLNGDGADEILVGASFAGAFEHGEAYLFSGLTGGLLHRWNGETTHGSYFGADVACIGDQDRDGVVDWAIGSPSQFFPGFEGKVFLYSGANGRLIHTITSAPGTSSHLGEVMDGGLDLTGDGYPDALITDNTFPVNGVPSSGAAYVFSFDPFLDASERNLSASAGGTIQFAADFPATESGFAYRLLASSNALGGPSGIGKPWVKLNGVKIPLVETPILHRMWNQPPGVFVGASGTLDAQGDATIVLTMPPGAAASEIGRTVRFAAVSIGAGGQASLSSAAALLTIQP